MEKNTRISAYKKAGHVGFICSGHPDASYGKVVEKNESLW
jgi:hypothetical protein